MVICAAAALLLGLICQPVRAQGDAPDQAPPPPPPPVAAAIAPPAASASSGAVSATQNPMASIAVVQHAANKLSSDSIVPRFLVYDAGVRRLMLGGTAPGRSRGLLVISLDSGSVKPLGVGSANALAIDPDDNKIFVALAQQPQIYVLDRKSLQRIDTILLATEAGTLCYDARDHLLVASASGQALAWIIDARQHVIVDSAVLSGAASSSVFDAAADRAYLSVASADNIDVIDPANHAVAALWQLAPSFAPQSLALVSRPHQLAVAGSRGALACVDADTGKFIGTASLPQGTGSLAADPSAARVIYQASITGASGVFSLQSNSSPAYLGQFAAPPGSSAEAAVFDQTSRSNVYVAYDNGSGTYLQRFTLPTP